MKGVVFHSTERPLVLEDVSVKEPGAGEVRVAIRAAGLCHSDLSVVDGSIPYPAPVVLGHEGAGVVEAVGPEVSSVKEGDRVVLSTLAHCGRCPACETGRASECPNAPKMLQPFTVDGKSAYQFANTSTFVEKTVVKEQSAIPIDPRVPFECACLIGCGVMTGVGAVVNRAKVETGASMAVFGVGGIGLNCLQGGVLAGAAKIIAVDVSAQKLEIARRFGATHGIDASKEDPVAAIRDLTGGGADYTFECVGNVDVIRQGLEALGAGGALTIVGVPKMGSAASFVVHALYQNKAILGCRYGTARPRKDFAMLAELFLSGRLRIAELVTRHYSLDEAAGAFDDLRRGALARGVFVTGS